MATRLIQTGQEVQNILNNAIELFWAKYGETTYAEIDAAVASGALVACMHDSSAYFYSGIAEDNNTMVFSKFGASATPPSVDTILLNIGNNQWSEGDTVLLENAGNKIKTTDSHPEYQLESDDKYLSSKSTSQFFNRRASALQLTGGHVMYIHLGPSVTTDLPFYRVWYGDGTGAPYGEIIIELQKRLVSWTPPDAAEYAYAIKAINIGTTDSVAVSFVQASGDYWLKISVPSDGTRNAPFYVTASDGSEARVSQSCGGAETEIVAATVVNFAPSTELANYMPKSGGRFSGPVIFEDRASFEGPLSLDEVQIHGLADPTSLRDAANKQYVDSGLATKASASDVSDIDAKIPAQASAQNQLADKNFVNSSIQTATATFKGNWETWGDVPFDTASSPSGWGTPDNNDYMVVRDASGYAPKWVQDNPDGYEVGDYVNVFSWLGTSDGLYRCISPTSGGAMDPGEDTEHWEEVTENPAYEGTWRFKYVPNGQGYDPYNWLPEYQVNEKPLTAEQLAALNSGITANKVSKLDALPTNSELETALGGKQETLVSGTNIKTLNNESLLGSGNITVAADTSDCVKVTSQSFTDAQKAIARGNIDAANAIRITNNDMSTNPYIRISLGDEFAARIDITGHYSGGDVVQYVGSLLVQRGDNNVKAYYYGYNFDDLISSLDVYDDEMNAKVLLVTPNSDLDYITLTVCPLVGNTASASLIDDLSMYSLVDNIVPEMIGAGGGVTPVTSWQNPPTDTDVPSEKLVYDSLGKYGVISQTQTWTQDADGGYHYDMSGQVYGAIPQANIDLFVAAGATFNTGTGYFELNGLTDISYEEMKEIYNIYSAMVVLGGVGGELLREEKSLRTISLKNGGAKGFAYAFYGQRKLEVVGVTTGLFISSSNNMFNDNRYLKEFGASNPWTAQLSSVPTNMFHNCFSLVTTKINSLGRDISFAQSARLSMASIEYMITNAGSNTITITLHPTAYAAAQSDAGVQAALSSKTNVSLASA